MPQVRNWVYPGSQRRLETLGQGYRTCRRILYRGRLYWHVSTCIQVFLSLSRHMLIPMVRGQSGKVGRAMSDVNLRLIIPHRIYGRSEQRIERKIRNSRRQGPRTDSSTALGEGF
jgi:hypothetical protein